GRRVGAGRGAGARDLHGAAVRRAAHGRCRRVPASCAVAGRRIGGVAYIGPVRHGPSAGRRSLRTSLGTDLAGVPGGYEGGRDARRRASRRTIRRFRRRVGGLSPCDEATAGMGALRPLLRGSFGPATHFATDRAIGLRPDAYYRRFITYIAGALAELAAPV